VNEPRFVSYAEFGQQFFDQAVTAERVLGAVDLLAGQPIDVGPMGVGPGRLVRLTARGSIGRASIAEVPGEWIAYRVELPVSLAFEVDLGIEVQKFKARLQVPLVLSARACDGLKVLIDVKPPNPGEVTVDLQAQGLRASVLNKVADVEGEVRRFVAKYVAREVDKPHVRAARTIDVGASVDAAWARIAPTSPSPTAALITDDLRRAIGDEEWDGA
jgi:hypothetical protein